MNAIESPFCCWFAFIRKLSCKCLKLVIYSCSTRTRCKPCFGRKWSHQSSGEPIIEPFQPWELRELSLCNLCQFIWQRLHSLRLFIQIIWHRLGTQVRALAFFFLQSILAHLTWIATVNGYLYMLPGFQPPLEIDKTSFCKIPNSHDWCPFCQLTWEAESFNFSDCSDAASLFHPANYLSGKLNVDLVE